MISPNVYLCLSHRSLTAVSIGERLFGPYVWGRYDLLVMPPSFPYGGMENPTLTFVTPALLAGDRSLIDVVIHEIAHSWFGNLVTNANWSEFWLNEGFTMYAQRRISIEKYGLAFTCLEARTGRALMEQCIVDNPPELTKLRVIIEAGVNPDDTYTETPYEKGYAFVCYLRSKVGSDEAFDGWLRAYCEHFKHQSIIAEDMFTHFFAHFPELQSIADAPGKEFQRWLTEPGPPLVWPDLSASAELSEPAEKLAAAWASGQRPTVDVSTWPSYQLCHFADTLMRAPLSIDTMTALDAAMPQLSSEQANAELRLRWCQLVVNNNYEAAFPRVLSFLHYTQKQKYTVPIYRLLMKGSDAARALAARALEETGSIMHPNVRRQVEKVLAS